MRAARRPGKKQQVLDETVRACSNTGEHFPDNGGLPALFRQPAANRLQGTQILRERILDFVRNHRRNFAEPDQCRLLPQLFLHAHARAEVVEGELPVNFRSPPRGNSPTDRCSGRDSRRPSGRSLRGRPRDAHSPVTRYRDKYPSCSSRYGDGISIETFRPHTSEARGTRTTVRRGVDASIVPVGVDHNNTSGTDSIIDRHRSSLERSRASSATRARRGSQDARVPRFPRRPPSPRPTGGPERWSTMGPRPPGLRGRRRGSSPRRCGGIEPGSRGAHSRGYPWGIEHVHVPGQDGVLAVAEQTFCRRIEGFDQGARVKSPQWRRRHYRQYGRQHLAGAIRRIGA